MMIHFPGRGVRSDDWSREAGTGTLFTQRLPWLPPGPDTWIAAIREADHAG